MKNDRIFLESFLLFQDTSKLLHISEYLVQKKYEKYFRADVESAAISKLSTAPDSEMLR